LVRTIAACASPSIRRSRAAATRIFKGSGKLSGATGVNVGGSLYDLLFLGGSCEPVFDGCDIISNFDFQSEANAEVAAQALFDQVFIGLGDTIRNILPTA
jgi:hypothetical protein